MTIPRPFCVGMADHILILQLQAFTIMAEGMVNCCDQMLAVVNFKFVVTGIPEEVLKVRENK